MKCFVYNSYVLPNEKIDGKSYKDDIRNHLFSLPRFSLCIGDCKTKKLEGDDDSKAQPLDCVPTRVFDSQSYGQFEKDLTYN